MMMAENEKNIPGFASIPERWVEKEIKDLELDTAYVTKAHCDAMDFSFNDMPRLWVDECGRAMLTGDMVIPEDCQEFDEADLMGESFGVMRVYEKVGNSIKEGFVVDIRYMNPGVIPRIDTTKVPDDQEDYNSYLEMLAATIPVAAVIASKNEHDEAYLDGESSQKVKQGSVGGANDGSDSPIESNYRIYGDAAFFPAAEYLVQKIDAVIQQTIAKENTKKEQPEIINIEQQKQKVRQFIGKKAAQSTDAVKKVLSKLMPQ